MTQGFEVVISDYRMPDLSGLDFLKAFAALPLQQDCVPIVLSGQTDFDALIRMINETHIYRFVPKPWSSYFLRSSISQAIDFRQAKLENRRLAQILREHAIGLSRDVANDIAQILVVDDDLGAANAIARSLMQRSLLDKVFRAAHEDAEGRAPEIDSLRLSVQVTTSPRYALKMAEEVEFSCVIADSRMPEMDGSLFLAAFAAKQPDCMAIMLSGAATLENLVIALDLAHIHSFLTKPWVDYELRAVLAQALMRRRLLLENRALAEICRAHRLDAVD